jgi:hypothetical protein
MFLSDKTSVRVRHVCRGWQALPWSRPGLACITRLGRGLLDHLAHHVPVPHLSHRLHHCDTLTPNTRSNCAESRHCGRPCFRRRASQLRGSCLCAVPVYSLRRRLLLLLYMAPSGPAPPARQPCSRQPLLQHCLASRVDRESSIQGLLWRWAPSARPPSATLAVRSSCHLTPPPL